MDIRCNLISKNTELIMHICKGYINEQTIAVDGTLGNGFDTINLIKSGVNSIYSFDIQEIAIDRAKENINKFLQKENMAHLIKNIHLIKDCHTNINKYVDKIDLAIFNLGYLPKGDKKLTTANTSLQAIKTCLEILSKNGICCISLYHGHNDGKIERDKILYFAKSLNNKRFHCLHIQAINQKNSPPEVLMITKKF